MKRYEPVPAGLKRDEYGQIYDPRFGKPPPPARNGRRDSNVYSDDYSEDEYDSEIGTLIWFKVYVKIKFLPFGIPVD